MKLKLLSNNICFRKTFEDHSISVVDDSIFVCGGSLDGQSCLILKDEVECFDAYYNCWKHKASMGQKRARSAITMHDGLLYIVGGMFSCVNNKHLFDKVEHNTVIC